MRAQRARRRRAVLHGAPPGAAQRERDPVRRRRRAAKCQAREPDRVCAASVRGVSLQRRSRDGERRMEDLFDVGNDTRATRTLPLTTSAAEIQVFDIRITGTRELAWRTLFEGFQQLKVITFSASVPAILDVAQMFEDVEITFGSERVLSQRARRPRAGEQRDRLPVHRCARRPEGVHRAPRAAGSVGAWRAAARARPRRHASVPVAAPGAEPRQALPHGGARAAFAWSPAPPTSASPR